MYKKWAITSLPLIIQIIKNKFKIKELIYNFCLFYSFGSFSIIKIKTNKILILANNNFASKKK